jgi:hypothetical protein
MIVSEKYDSTVEEIKELKGYIDKNGPIKEVVLIGDKYHIRSIRQIVNYYIEPTIDKKYISVDGKWAGHPMKWQASEQRWFVANILRYILFAISPSMTEKARHYEK